MRSYFVEAPSGVLMEQYRHWTRRAPGARCLTDVFARYLFTAASLLALSSPAFGQPLAAGRIKVVTGTAFVVRGTDATPAHAGAMVYEGDTLRTGADGRLALTLKDDTRLSLDPNTELRLDRFAYAPGEGRLGFVLKMVRGAVAYVSGRIAKLSPDAIRLETPNAIVGVRGTRLVIRVAAS